MLIHPRDTDTGELGKAVLYRSLLAFINRRELLPWFDVGMARIAEPLPPTLTLGEVLAQLPDESHKPAEGEYGSYDSPPEEDMS